MKNATKNEAPELPKLRRRINKKAALILSGKALTIAFAAYGMVSGYNAFAAYSVRSYHAFVASEADKMGVVKTETQVQYVVDPQKAAEAVSAAAKEGAKQGADASIKANLGK